MTALSVTIDGRSLADASSYRGLGTYVRQLVAGLADVAALDLSVLAEADVALPPGVTRVLTRRRGPERWASAEHQIRLALLLGRRPAGSAGADVFHSPALDPPRRPGRPWVQTVADVLPLASDSPAYAVERARWKRRAARVRSADAVIAISRHSAEQAVRLLGVSPERVHVVHLAADARFRPLGAAREGGDGGVPAPYLLTVAEYAPHKGFEELSRVAGELVDAGLPHRLVLAGRVTEQWRGAMEKALFAGGQRARDRIDVVGWVPDLLPLYRGADALVCTSRHEGFGLPLVEAMATATPVFAFDNSAVTEVVGNGGTLVPDGDWGALAGRLIEVLGSGPARRELSAAAQRRSGCFDWADTVGRHVGIYRQVAEAAP